MDASATTDEALMRRYVAGDVAAFDGLYERHELPLWRYILRHCGNRATAEEVMQDVWFAVARQATQFRPDARFTSWLYTMARNRVIDRHRTMHPQLSLDAATGESGVSLLQLLEDHRSPSPLHATEQAQLGQSILAAMDRLPREQREAFVLQVDSGLTVEQIASITGTSFETAKSRLRYARERLKELLREHA